MPRTPDIKLTPREQELLTQIDFSRIDDEKTRASMMPMMALTELLLKRDAVPMVRLQYYTEADRYPKGRGLSREERFAENGTHPNEAHAQESFLPRLHYYIFGPDLPSEAFAIFKDASKRAGHLAYSDLSDVLPSLKKLVQQQRLDPSRAADEFHKLAFEHGAVPSTAAGVRDSIRKVRLPTGRG